METFYWSLGVHHLYGVSLVLVDMGMILGPVVSSGSLTKFPMDLKQYGGQPNFSMVLTKAQRLAKRELADIKGSFSQGEVTQCRCGMDMRLGSQM